MPKGPFLIRAEFSSVVFLRVASTTLCLIKLSICLQLTSLFSVGPSDMPHWSFLSFSFLFYFLSSPAFYLSFVLSQSHLCYLNINKPTVLPKVESLRMGHGAHPTNVFKISRDQLALLKFYSHMNQSLIKKYNQEVKSWSVK